jgi:serine/threonine protein kinase
VAGAGEDGQKGLTYASSAVGPTARVLVPPYNAPHLHRTMIFAPGTRLGPYEILELAGAGGMGAVYRARDTRLRRTVAIKVASSRMTEHPHLRTRLQHEARAIAALNHPNICAIHDVATFEGHDVIVMELALTWKRIWCA